MGAKQVNVFLDSGAYSAFKKHIEIKVEDYIDFIKRSKDTISVYANLDVIGDAEATLKNQKIMEDAGLNPIPCFHRKEDFKYLRHYIENYDYIALGGVADDKDREQHHEWMLRCWDIICDTPDHLPACKVHGFAITSIDVMTKYPWWSVDSTSWVLTGRFGCIYVPQYRNGEYLYDQNTWKVAISNISPRHKEEDKHFASMNTGEKETVLRYLDAKGFKLGKSELRKEDKKTYKLKEGEKWANQEDANLCREMIDREGIYFPSEFLIHPDIVETVIEPGVSNDYKQRDAANITYFLDLEKSVQKWPWPWQRKGIKPLF